MKTKWLVALVLAPLGALAAGQVRTIEIAVTQNGFEPARVQVAKGEPLKLVVTRKTDDTCAKQIVIPDENIKADLPLNRPVTLSFTPKRSGEITYACGMNMITGVLEVASSDATGSRANGTDASREVPGSAGMRGMQGRGGSKGDDRAATKGMSCGCMHRGSESHGT